MGPRRILLAAAVAATTGCSLLVSTSGLTSDGSPPPSQADAAEGGTTDGPPPAIEAGTPDAPADVDAGPPSPCKGTHAFCDDFDRTNAPESGWSSTSVTPGVATMSIVDDRAVSAPRALFTKLPRREPAGAVQYAVLEKTLSGSFSKAIISWDMFVVRPAFQNGDINVGVGCFSGRVDNTRGYGCMSIGADYASLMGATIGPFPWDRWVHMELTMPADGAPSVRVDNGTTETGNYEIEASVGSPELRIDLGLHGYNRPAPAFTVYYDNLVVDVLP